MTDDTDLNAKPPSTPALFATIHFRSGERPDGYTDDDIIQLNRITNQEIAHE